MVFGCPGRTSPNRVLVCQRCDMEPSRPESSIRGATYYGNSTASGDPSATTDPIVLVTQRRPRVLLPLEALGIDGLVR